MAILFERRMSFHRSPCESRPVVRFKLPATLGLLSTFLVGLPLVIRYASRNCSKESLVTEHRLLDGNAQPNGFPPAGDLLRLYRDLS
jgi:hypothetical protein